MTRWVILASVLAGCAQILGISDPGDTPGGSDAIDAAHEHADGHGDGHTAACVSWPGAGTPTTFPVPGAMALAVGKLSADQKLDVIVAAGSNLLLLPGDNIGHFGSAAPLTTTAVPATNVIVADVDGDHFDDIVSWQIGTTGVTVQRQDATHLGSFLPAQRLTLDLNANTILAGDIDQDGRADLVVAGAATGGLEVYLASAASPGTFTELAPVSTQPFDLTAVADVDSDMYPDLVGIGTSGAQIWFNRETSPEMFDGPTKIGTDTLGIVAGRFGQGTAGPLDVVTFGTSGGTLYHQPTARDFMLDGLEIDLPIPEVPANGQPLTQVIDVNDDGRDDVVALDEAALQCTGITSAGQFVPGPSDPTQTFPLGGPTRSQLFVDLTGDGKPELLLLDDGAGEGSALSVYLQ